MSLSISKIFENDDSTLAKCPSCHKNFILETIDGKLKTHARSCKYCNFWIEESKIIFSNLINETLSEATQSAGEIPDFHSALLPNLAFILFEIFICYLFRNEFYFLMHFVFAFTSFNFYGGFSICNGWLKKYGEIRIYDEYLMAEKKRISLTRNIWGFSLFLNLVIWLTFIMYSLISK